MQNERHLFASLTTVKLLTVIVQWLQQSLILNIVFGSKFLHTMLRILKKKISIIIQNMKKQKFIYVLFYRRKNCRKDKQSVRFALHNVYS